MQDDEIRELFRRMELHLERLDTKMDNPEKHMGAYGISFRDVLQHHRRPLRQPGRQLGPQPLGRDAGDAQRSRLRADEVAVAKAEYYAMPYACETKPSAEAKRTASRKDPERHRQARAKVPAKRRKQIARMEGDAQAQGKKHDRG